MKKLRRKSKQSTSDEPERDGQLDTDEESDEAEDTIVEKGGKSLIRVIVVTIIVVVLVIGGAIFYIWWTGRKQPPVPNIMAGSPATDSQQDTPGRKYNPNTPVSVSIQSMQSKARYGETLTTTVLTRPKIICTPKLVMRNAKTKYIEPKIIYKAAGLMPQKSDEFGYLTWDWKFGNDASAGTWVAQITCQNGKRSGVVQQDIVLK